MVKKRVDYTGIKRDDCDCPRKGKQLNDSVMGHKNRVGLTTAK